MKHTFDNSYNFKREDLTDNLMNYNNGVQLSKYQWDVVHDPGIALGLFDSDDDAQASEVGIKTTAIADFVTPNGYLIRLPAQTEILYGCDYDDGELPAGTLRRFKTANGKVYNIVTQGNKLSNPDTWRFLGYKCNGVSYPNTEGVASSSVVRVDQTMLESSAANSATKGQLKLSFSTLNSAIPRYTEGVAPTIKFNIFEGSTNGAAIGQPLIVVKPCAAAIASTLPPSFGMTGVQFRDFVESLKGMGKGFDDGGICVKIVTIDYEKGAIPKIIHEPRNCGGSTNLITLTLRYKDPADGNPSVGNGVVMVWDLAGAYSPPCVREYVLEGVRKLEQNIVYIGKVDAEKLLIKGGYIIYRTVIGLVSCSTNPTAAADLKARGGTDAELFTMGMTYELITLVDVLGMAEGIVDIAGIAAKAVVNTYVDCAKRSSATISRIATRQPVTEEEVLNLFISADKQLFLQGIIAAKKIGEELKKEYVSGPDTAYQRGRLTVLVVPIIFTGGAYLVAKGPQMLGKMSRLLSRTVQELGHFGGIMTVLTKLYNVSKVGLIYIFKRGDGVIVGKASKQGEKIRLIRSECQPEFVETWERNIDGDVADWNNQAGSGATPVIVDISDWITLENQIRANLSQSINNDNILNKLIVTMRDIAGEDGVLLANKLAKSKLAEVEGYVDLIKKASIDQDAVRSVNQALEKAEDLLKTRAGTSKIDLRFEHDLKTGLHDVDLGIKTPNNSNQYIEAYQFKTKKQGLRTSDIADASKQLKEVISQKKIVEIKCLDGVTAETLGLPEIIREMKFQAKLIDPLKGAGIHEFHFILPNGTKVIKITSFL